MLQERPQAQTVDRYRLSAYWVPSAVHVCGPGWALPLRGLQSLLLRSPQIIREVHKGGAHSDHTPYPKFFCSLKHLFQREHILD